MRDRRAFSLVEILLAVSLLGVFMLLASRVITANFHVITETITADSNSARFDQAIQMLRADVAVSKSIELRQPQLLRIYSRSNQLIEWQTSHNSLSRTQAGKNRTWDVGHPLDLKLDGAVVLLSADSIDEIAMASLQTGAPR